MQNFRRKIIEDDICDKLGLSNDLPPTHQKLSRALKYLRKEDVFSTTCISPSLKNQMGISKRIEKIAMELSSGKVIRLFA